MTHDEFHERLDAWALGALSDDERAEMERHVAAHPDVRPAVKRAFTSAAALGEALPPAPPAPGAWQRIVAALPGRAGPPAPARRRWGAMGWLAAAVAAAVALWLWFDRDDRRARERTLRAELAARDRAAGEQTLAAQARLDGCVRDLEALRSRDALAGEAVALLELAGTQLIPLEPPAGGPSTVAANAIYHRGVKRAYVVVKGLDADAAGYEIWVNRAGQRLPAGRLAPVAGGGVIASVAADTLDDVPESFEVTRPAGEVILRSRIKI